MWRALLAGLIGLAQMVGASFVDAQSRDISVEGLHAERRVALVIGNGAYPKDRLRNPVNDARAMAETLRALKFEVLRHENLGEKDMRRAIDAFGARLRGSGVGLFYYSGHGIQVGGKNYLVPVDARLDSESDVEYDAVDVGRVLAKMEAVQNRLNIVILDACRNNPFERAWRSVGGGLAQMLAPSGTFIAYATAPGRVASDGSGTNGLYTAELLKAMRLPGLTLEDVFKRVGRSVKDQTKGAQEPWISSNVYGYFAFAMPTPRIPGGQAVRETDAARQEEAQRLAEERQRLAEERARHEEQERKAAEERRRVEQQLEDQRKLAALQKQREEQAERDARERRSRRIREWLKAWRLNPTYTRQCGDSVGRSEPGPMEFAVKDISPSGEVTAEFSMYQNQDGDLGVRAWKGTATENGLRLRPDAQPRFVKNTVHLVESGGELEVFREGDRYRATFTYRQTMRSFHKESLPFLSDKWITCTATFSYSGPLQ